ncbi:hypothetical protein B6U81_07375 [Thermoplasmatales archaeon ex4484_30]|nr:MAG: hypothetical protein B6U81_07375 [Thermoplasmatales archaeon ex4484_30]
MFPLLAIQILFLVKRKDVFSLLSRFVVDKEGRRIGESISVYKDLLIIKRNGKFYAIPLKHVEVGKEELHVKGVVQWEIAEKLAKEWKKNV